MISNKHLVPGISNNLTHLGFTLTKSDPLFSLVFYKSLVLFILIYINDILVTKNSKFSITTLIATLNKAFSLKDLGPPLLP